MADTISQSIPKLGAIYESAFQRAGIPAEMITAGHLNTAKRLLNLLLSELATSGVRLWVKDVILLGMRAGLSKVPTPAGTLEIDDVVIRQQTITTGTFSGAGVGFALTLATPVAAQYIGAKVSTPGIFDVTLEVSSDGISWSELASFPQQEFFANQWNWFEIMPASDSVMYFRLREETTLNVTDMCVSIEGTERLLGNYSREDYTYSTNKRTQGSVNNYYVDRQASGPVLYLHYAPDSAHEEYQLVVWRKRHIKDAGAMTSNIEVPQRWVDAVIWDLAWRLAAEIPEAQPKGDIAGTARAKIATITETESDGGGMRFEFSGMRAYTA